MNWGIFALGIAVGLLLGVAVGLLLHGMTRMRQEIANERSAQLDLLWRVKDLERRMDKIATEYAHPGGRRDGAP